MSTATASTSPTSSPTPSASSSSQGSIPRSRLVLFLRTLAGLLVLLVLVRLLLPWLLDRAFIHSGSLSPASHPAAGTATAASPGLPLPLCV